MSLRRVCLQGVTACTFVRRLVVTAALAWPVLAGAADVAVGRLLGDSLCLQVKFAQGQAEADLETLPQLQVHWVRDQVLWPEIEKQAGVYGPWPKDFEKRLKFYREHDIGIILLLSYGNSLAYPDSANAPYHSLDPVAYGRYVAELARRLKVARVRFVIEVWNEPHNSLQPVLGGNWVGAPPSAWVDHYIRLLEEAVRQVKAIDPAIRVISDDDMWVVHYHMLARGLPRGLDGLAIHPYSAGQPPDFTAVTQDTEWTKPYTVVDADRSFESAMRRLREFALLRTGKPLGIWITEWGWAIGEKTPYGAATEEMVADFLPRALILGHATGAEATCWFSAQDTVDGPMGLQDNAGHKRMAYAAYQKLAETLGRARYVCEMAAGPENAGSRRGFVFKDDSAYIIASWPSPAFSTAFTEGIRYDRVAAAPACKTATKPVTPVSSRGSSRERAPDV